jgi:YegS/Rv2252/BmrU family lipid kinase
LTRPLNEIKVDTIAQVASKNQTAIQPCIRSWILCSSQDFVNQPFQSCYRDQYHPAVLNISQSIERQIMKLKVIVNPTAGKGYGARSVPKIEALLAAQGLDFDLVQTSWAGEAIEIARQAMQDGYDTLVAVGGDGTYQEVINGMLSRDPNVNGHAIGTLGLLPVGSGCDFAWSMGVPSDLGSACALLAQRQTRIVDVGRITVDGKSRYFDNTVGIGFEGVVTVEAKKVKYLRGMALYVPVVLKSIFLSLSPARSTITYESDGHTHRIEGSFLMIDICNGKRAGGSFFVAPDAEPDDGLFDICLVPDISRARMLALLPHFLKGTHANQPEVTTLRCDRIEITSMDGLFAHADGELLCMAAHRIACETLPKKIRVLC